MPTELRKLVFSSEDLSSAAINHCLHNNIKVPQTNVDDTVVGKNDDAMLTVTFVAVSGESKVSVR